MLLRKLIKIVLAVFIIGVSVAVYVLYTAPTTIRNFLGLTDIGLGIRCTIRGRQPMLEEGSSLGMRSVGCFPRVLDFGEPCTRGEDCDSGRCILDPEEYSKLSEEIAPTEKIPERVFYIYERARKNLGSTLTGRCSVPNFSCNSGPYLRLDKDGSQLVLTCREPTP